MYIVCNDYQPLPELLFFMELDVYPFVVILFSNTEPGTCVH